MSQPLYWASSAPRLLRVREGCLPSREFVQNAQRVWLLAAEKVEGLIRAYPDRFPTYTTNGKWDWEGETWTPWCEGFLGGELWLISGHVRDPWFREMAERYSRLVMGRRKDEGLHDLGFLIWPTWYRWFEKTREPAMEAVVIEAGCTLARRFREPGGYLCSFLGPHSLFIDIMMNVGVVFYAAERLREGRLGEIAWQHCITTGRTLVRADGSVAHEGVFDQETGDLLHQATQQGWREDGCWARGLAWAIYGFGTAYMFSGDLRLLRWAVRCADYYIEGIGRRLIPPNDLTEPAPARPYESSAAAVAGAGLWQLASLVQGDRRARGYGQYALKILSRLLEPEFLAREASWEGLLLHGTYHEGLGAGVDESVMWGDYYFLEALDAVERAYAAVEGQAI